MDLRLALGLGLVLASAGCLGCESTGGAVDWTEPGVYEALGDTEGGRTDAGAEVQTPHRSLPFNASSFEDDWPGFRPTSLHFFTAAPSYGTNLTAIDDWDDYPDDGHQTLEIHLRAWPDRSDEISISGGTYAEYEEEPGTPWNETETRQVLSAFVQHVTRADADATALWIETVVDEANFTDTGFYVKTLAPAWIDVGVATNELLDDQTGPTHINHHDVGGLQVEAVGWEIRFDGPIREAHTTAEGFPIRVSADTADRIQLLGDLGDRDELGPDRWADLFQRALDDLGLPSERFSQDEVWVTSSCGFA